MRKIQEVESSSDSEKSDLDMKDFPNRPSSQFVSSVNEQSFRFQSPMVRNEELSLEGKNNFSTLNPDRSAKTVSGMMSIKQSQSYPEPRTPLGKKRGGKTSVK